jgi:uncharacterized protein (DUF2147 family)
MVWLGIGLAGRLLGGALMTKVRARGSVVLAAVAFGLMGWSLPARALPVEGSWVIRDLVLDIFNCQGSVCGKVAWTKNPQQRRTECGRTIVWGLSPDGPETWSGGSIFDPTDGNTYRLSATLESDGTLHARIYRGVPLFGKTEVLKRVQPRSLDGWCA